MPMYEDDVAVLLGMMAAFDYRNTDEADARLWHRVVGDLDFEDCEAAIIAHYQTSGERMKPVDLRNGVKRIRDQRAASQGAPVGAGEMLEIPDADPDDVPAYLAAVRAQRFRTGDRGLKPRPVAALIAGCRLPAVPPLTEFERAREVRAQLVRRPELPVGGGR